MRPGTNPGKVLRVPERGFQHGTSARRGDHYVTLAVKIPTYACLHPPLSAAWPRAVTDLCRTLTDKQKDMMRSWALEERGRVGTVTGVADGAASADTKADKSAGKTDKSEPNSSA